MTDLTTRPVEVGKPHPPSGSKPTNGAVVADARTLRHVTRVEQERLSADAEVERRARAARLDLELQEQRRAAARREREANAAEKLAQVEQRRARRDARRARLRAAAPRWADRALFVLPIMFPMAVAWVGQIRFAMTVMNWPLPAAIVFAAGFELSTAYVARLDWLSRAAGDSGLLFRGATWGFAAGAATMNYWHAAGPNFAPNGEAVSYGLMSITGVVLWELLSTYRHRTALRAEGKLPSARPRFGLARWIWFGKLTRLAYLLALRDGYTTTDQAWRAALAAVNATGSPKNARKAVRTGRPVPRPAPRENDERDDTAETAERRGAGRRGHQRDVGTRTGDRDGTGRYPDRDRGRLVREELRPAGTRHGRRDSAKQDASRNRPGDTASAGQIPNRDGSRSSSVLEVRNGRPAALPAHESLTTSPGGRSEDHATADEAEPATVPDHGAVGQGVTLVAGHEPARTDRYVPDAGRGHGDVRHDADEQAVSTRMLAYARERLANGAPVTGADLDREFGTRDYGRKILRRLSTAP